MIFTLDTDTQTYAHICPAVQIDYGHENEAYPTTTAKIFERYRLYPSNVHERILLASRHFPHLWSTLCSSGTHRYARRVHLCSYFSYTKLSNRKAWLLVLTRCVTCPNMLVLYTSKVRRSVCAEEITLFLCDTKCALSERYSALHQMIYFPLR